MSRSRTRSRPSRTGSWDCAALIQPLANRPFLICNSGMPSSAQSSTRRGQRGEQAARALRNHLDSIVPSYADARGNAAKFFNAEDAHDAGGVVRARMSGLDAQKIGEAQARQSNGEYGSLGSEAVPAEFLCLAHHRQGREIQGDNQDITKKIYNSKFARDQIEMGAWTWIRPPSSRPISRQNAQWISFEAPSQETRRRRGRWPELAKQGIGGARKRDGLSADLRQATPAPVIS